MKFSLTFTLYSLSLSFLIGIVAAFFLGIVNFLIHIVWVGVPSALHLGTFYPLVIGLIGGVLVGLFQSRIGPYPKTMHETIQEFQTTKRVHYEKQIWKNFVAAIIVLAFGASLGPEAALASILGGLISWLGDRLKLTMFKKEELLNLSLGALLATIFHAPFMGITTPLEEGFRQGQIQVKWKKTVLYILSTVAGLLGFAFVNQFFPKEKVFAIRLGAIHWEGQVIYLLLPALLLGMAFGYFFLATERFFDYLALKINQKILLALVAGLCIGLFGIIYYRLGNSILQELKKENDSSQQDKPFHRSSVSGQQSPNKETYAILKHDYFMRKDTNESRSPPKRNPSERTKPFKESFKYRRSVTNQVKHLERVTSNEFDQFKNKVAFEKLQREIEQAKMSQESDLFN